MGFTFTKYDLKNQENMLKDIQFLKQIKLIEY